MTSNVLPQSHGSRPRKFLDLLPDGDRKQAAGAFIRAIRRAGDPEQAIDLLMAWLTADFVTATSTEEKERIRRLIEAVRDFDEAALGYARSTAAWLKGQPT